MSTFSFPDPASYGQDLPAQSGVPAARPDASADGELFGILTLADLTLFRDPRDVAAAAKRLLEKTDVISDEKLRTSVRLSLAETVAEPENFPEIRAKHFRKISLRFTELADEARKNKNFKAALNSAQIAAKADPKNLRARLILASLIDAGGDTPTALRLMHAGLKFIDLDAPVTDDYFSKYFEMLFALQQDFVLSEQAAKILKNPNVPEKTRRLVALAGAFALYNRGRCAESLDLIARERLDEPRRGNDDAVHGRVLRARNLFASGRRDEAIALLDSSVAQFPAERRELIFNQLSRFFSETENCAGVLDVAKRQLEENPDALSPRLRRLFAYRKLGNAEAFDAELETVFAQHSSSQSALVALANFAAEQGLPELALRCMKTARERSFEPGIFVAAAVEALVAAKRPDEAIDAYIQASGTNPHAFDGFETVLAAVLASAYAEAADAEPDAAVAARERAYSERLLNQFLENAEATPENRLAAVRHFRRIGRDDLADRIATAALKAFPWHSQLRADWISLQLASRERAAKISVPAELRTLAELRRPDPAIWKEALAWLDSDASADAKIPAEERERLRAMLAELAR